MLAVFSWKPSNQLGLVYARPFNKSRSAGKAVCFVKAEFMSIQRSVSHLREAART